MRTGFGFGVAAGLLLLLVVACGPASGESRAVGDADAVGKGEVVGASGESAGATSAGWTAISPKVRELFGEVATEAVLHGTRHELCMLHPDSTHARSPKFGGEREFFDFAEMPLVGTYRQIAKTKLNYAHARETLTALIANAESYDPNGGSIKCFMPRHAIRIQHGERDVAFIICFQCQRVEVWVDGSELLSAGWSNMDRKPFREVVDRAMKRAELPQFLDAEIRSRYWQSKDQSGGLISDEEYARFLPESMSMCRYAEDALGAKAMRALLDSEHVTVRRLWPAKQPPSDQEKEAWSKQGVANKDRHLGYPVMEKLVLEPDRSNEPWEVGKWRLIRSVLGIAWGDKLPEEFAPEFCISWQDSRQTWNLLVDSQRKSAAMHREDGPMEEMEPPLLLLRELKRLLPTGK